jgi:hypothetical protein
MLVEAMAANPLHKITNRKKAMDYFRGMARNRLAATDDPLARFHVARGGVVPPGGRIAQEGRVRHALRSQVRWRGQ